MARYLLIVTFEPGVVDSPMEEWQPEEITAHLDYYRALNHQLVESGELVDATILTPPDAAHIVRADASGGRVVTDGPFQEFKEWAAGFQVDRRRDRGAGARDRRARLGRPRAGRRAAPAADPRAPGHGRRAVRRRRDGGLAGGRGGRALSTDRTAEDLLRDLAPQVVGILTRRSGDFTAAEDAVQEALVAAHLTWPRDGIPDHPRAWLVTAATRRLVDEQRSAAARRRREQDWAAAQPEGAEAVQQDDSLTVLLMCCHPALSPASAVALTLRAVGGLTTAEIATAYLVPEPTMAQRISRAKRTLHTSGATFELPAGDELGDRVRRALAVVYLLYNEGYAASAGADLTRTDRSAEAIRLGRLVHRLLPDDPEATALLALMLLLDARRPARVTASGDLVTARRAGPHASGTTPSSPREPPCCTRRSAPVAGPGSTRCRPRSPRCTTGRRPPADTDWPQVLALYGLLEEVAPSPFVTLARAVALAEAEGPDAAAPVLDSLDAALGDHQRLHAVRGHVAELRGDRAAARGHYLAAAARATNLAEQRHLTRLAAALAEPPG